MIKWHDPDVHMWSDRMSEVVASEFPHLVEACARARDQRGHIAAEQARAALPQHSRVLDKILVRRNAADPELCGLGPLGLFALVWEKRGELGLQAISDVLTDVGHTCLQGDTHRLFSLYVAHERSKR